MRMTAKPASAKTGKVTYTVTVVGVTGIIPTGSVSVSDGAGGTCTISSLNSSGKGNCKIVEAAGSYTVTATYSGDGNYNSAVFSIHKTVDKASPTILLKSSANPAPHPETIVYTVTLTGATGITPTGTASISDGQGGSCTTDELNSAGKGSCEITEAAGSYTVTATYSGDDSYKSVAAQMTETVHSG
jgi:hypothetical protein